MQDKRLFSRDALTGITTWFTYDEDTDKASLTAEQDVTGLCDDNVREQNAVARAGKRWGEFTRVASIPMSIWAQWMVEGRDRDAPYVRRWLNDRDNRQFRTRLGRV